MNTAFTPFAFGTNDVQVMAGNFDDCAFDDVVQVLGMSRQCLRLRVNQEDAVFSEVLLKAGQVLDARMQGTDDPRQVFNALGEVAMPGKGFSFSVYHTQPNGAFPAPKASLLDLHSQVRKPAPAAKRPGSEDVTVALDSRPPLTAPSMPAAASPRPAAAVDTSMRRDMGTLLELVQQQVEQQVQAQARIEGRLQALPQLIASEVRAAMAQLALQAAPAPAPRERRDSSSKALLGAAVALLGVLTVAAVFVAFKLVR